MIDACSQPYLFASFSSRDLGIVDRVVDQLSTNGISVWAAHRNLQPGEAWSEAIARAVSTASGVLVFLSSASLRSLWAKRELISAVNAQKRVFPIILGEVDPTTLPPQITGLAVLKIASEAREDDVNSVCKRIRDALKIDPDWQTGKTLFDAETTREVASNMSADLERGQEEPSTQGSENNSVFLVHGHDTSFVNEVLSYVSSLGIEPIALTRLGFDDQSLFQRFFRYGQKARFAIVLIGADDVGASRVQYDVAGIGDRALQFRARQNVVLELGFFFGRLGWQNVFILQQPPDKVFPNFERPSDLDGVVFNNLDASGLWKKQLALRLAQANLRIVK
jgi:predicted nucleotide-binding protein